MSIQKKPDPRDLRYFQFVTDRINGLADAQIAAKFDIESPKALYRRLSYDGYPVCPECGTAPVTGKHCEPTNGGRNPGAGTGQRRDLPPPGRAVRLLRERLKTLLRDAEGLASRHQSYQDRRFPGADVYPGTIAYFRYLPTGDGRRREFYSEEDWQKLCEQHNQDPKQEEFVLTDAALQAPTEAASAPPEPLTTLISVYALAGGEMPALLELLYPGEPPREVLEEVRKCVEGKKKPDKKDGLKTLARQLAILVVGGSIEGAPPRALSSAEHDAACFITQLREEGHSKEEIERRLSNHRKPDGSKLTAEDISRLGNMRLRYPRT